MPGNTPFFVFGPSALVMSFRAPASDVGLHLGRTAAVCAGDVLFFLGFRLHLFLRLLGFAFASAAEGDAAQDDGIDVVASEL